MTTPEQSACLSRRGFLNYAGLAIVAGAAITGCTKDENPEDSGIDLGSGDIGILNYAYALEQLEAAFYTQVVKTPYVNIRDEELAMLTDIRDHEVAHREFLKHRLAGRAIPNLDVDFSSIVFDNRASVLNAARMFEDLGVSAYNGAGKLLQSTTNLAYAGKIVSVEARHAAYIRELLETNSFADETIVDPVTRLDMARSPAEVLSLAQSFLKTKLNGSNLPTP